MAGLGNTILETYLLETLLDIDLINDNTLNDDAYLKYPMAVNEHIFFEIYAHYIAGAGGIQAAISGPAGFTHLHYSANLDVSGATKVTSNLATAYDTVVLLAAASQGQVRIVGSVTNGATPGDLVFRWCQNTSNGANTTIHTDSVMRVTRYVV